MREVALVRGKQQVVNSEAYRNLSMSKASSRYAVNVVNDPLAGSQLIQLTDVGLGERPAATGSDVIGSPSDVQLHRAGRHRERRRRARHERLD